MKGSILDFNNEDSAGIILGEDGNRYSFDFGEWKSRNKDIEIDANIDFIIKNNVATEIFDLNNKSKRVITKTKSFNVPNPTHCMINSYDYLIDTRIDEVINKPLLGFSFASFLFGLITSSVPLLIGSSFFFIIAIIMVVKKIKKLRNYMKKLNENLDYLKNNIKIHDIKEVNIEANESIIKTIEGRVKEELEFKLYVSAFLEGVSDIVILEKEELSSSYKYKVKFLK